MQHCEAVSAPHVTRSQIVVEARTWIGTPHHHRACVRGVGVDCLEVVRATLQAVGVPWPPLADAYETLLRGQQWFRHVPREFLVEVFQNVPALAAVSLTAIQPGDICLLAYPGRPCSHVALVSHAPPALQVIHVTRVSRRKEVVEQRVTPALWGFFRYAFAVRSLLCGAPREGSA